jgi:O-antigen/teichoic acid export membrane protein
VSQAVSQTPSQPGTAATRKLARHGSANLAGALVTAIAGFATVVVVTRAVGKAEAGAFFSATSLFLILCSIARLGTPTGVVWALARYRALGQRERIVPVLRTSLVPIAVLGVVAGIVMLLMDPRSAAVLLRTDGSAGDAGFVSMVRALALFVPVAVVYDTLTAATRGFGNMRATVLVERVARPAGQLALLGAAALGSSAVWLTAAWALPYLPAFAVTVAMLVRLVRRDEHGIDGEPVAAPAESVRREFWRFTAPRSLATVAQMASQRLDIVLVGALRGPIEAALYTAATRFLVVGQTAGLALSMSAQPLLGSLLARDDHAEANRVYRTATAWLVIVTWPLYLAMLVGGPVLLSIFGSGYEAGLPVMAILSLSMLVATACGMVDMVLTMAGKTTWNLANTLLALGVQIGLDLLLIPDHGILGAAWGWAAAIVVRNVVALVQIGVSTGMNPFGRATLVAGALAAGCFGALPGLARWALGGSVAVVFGSLVLGGLAYLGALYGARHVLELRQLPLPRKLRRLLK